MYDHVESYLGVSGCEEGLKHLPDGKFLPPERNYTLDSHFRNYHACTTGLEAYSLRLVAFLRIQKVSRREVWLVCSREIPEEVLKDFPTCWVRYCFVIFITDRVSIDSACSSSLLFIEAKPKQMELKSFFGVLCFSPSQMNKPF
jgi:hypothetical protein